ncbi:MAG: universal stress protein [Sebaldella sp.]|nr:universal stress protein [Sebaldella sp.]
MPVKRISPEEALEKYKKETRGKLKIYLGYAPGVGKTYTMLTEGNRLLAGGENIVIGYLEAHNRPETSEQVKKLKVLPRKKIIYQEKEFEEVDVEAILAYKPDIVLIDELAHTNISGSKNEKRYQDVIAILDKGINVYSTLNIQHLESLNNIIYDITHVQVRETIPDIVLEDADIEIVDIVPENLRNRLEKGQIYKEETAKRALKNFFRSGNLSALREIALRQIAEEVDDDVLRYKKEKGITAHWHTVERVLVCISSNPKAPKVIRHGARIARKYKCAFYVADVEYTRKFGKKATERDIKTLNENKKLALKLGAELVSLKGKSISGEITKFSEEKGITQILLGHSKRSKIQTLLRGSTINKIIDHSKNAEVRVIPWE